MQYVSPHEEERQLECFAKVTYFLLPSLEIEQHIFVIREAALSESQTDTISVGGTP